MLNSHLTFYLPLYLNSLFKLCCCCGENVLTSDVVVADMERRKDLS